MSFQKQLLLPWCHQQSKQEKYFPKKNLKRTTVCCFVPSAHKMSVKQFLDRFYTVVPWVLRVTKLEADLIFDKPFKQVLEEFLVLFSNGYHFCRLLFILSPLSIKFSAAAQAKDIFRRRANWELFRRACIDVIFYICITVFSCSFTSWTKTFCLLATMLRSVMW